MFDALIALGSNVGDKRANIDRAISELTRAGDIVLVARSRDFRTPPWGITDQDWFVNAAIGVDTELSAREVLARCLETERAMGRVRALKWGPRIIDLDVLAYRDERIADDDLVLPHPRIAERAFVLAPLADIAPDLVLDGRTVRDLLAAVDTTGVKPMKPEKK